VNTVGKEKGWEARKALIDRLVVKGKCASIWALNTMATFQTFDISVATPWCILYAIASYSINH
jgi:hypothetical protein